MDEELIKELKVAHKDEKDDYDHYMALSNKAKLKGCDEAAGILCDMAHDEDTHKKALAYILNMEE